jgi:hypothetical protein
MTESGQHGGSDAGCHKCSGLFHAVEHLVHEVSEMSKQKLAEGHQGHEPASVSWYLGSSKCDKHGISDKPRCPVREPRATKLVRWNVPAN